MAARRVLITGMSGLIGTALRTHIEGKYTLRALNRRPVPGVDCHQADLGDLEAIKPAFAGVHTVVHLAAAAGDSNAPADVMRSNVVGAYNVFEASRLAGVTRVIFASSGATVSAWEREPPISHIVAGRYDQVGEWVGFLKLSATYARRLALTLDKFVAEQRFDEPMEEAVRELLQSSPAGAFGICDVTDLPWIEIDFAVDVAKARDVILPAFAKVRD